MSSYPKTQTTLFCIETTSDKRERKLNTIKNSKAIVPSLYLPFAYLRKKKTKKAIKGKRSKYTNEKCGFFVTRETMFVTKNQKRNEAKNERENMSKSFRVGNFLFLDKKSVAKTAPKIAPNNDMPGKYGTRKNTNGLRYPLVKCSKTKKSRDDNKENKIITKVRSKIWERVMFLRRMVKSSFAKTNTQKKKRNRQKRNNRYKSIGIIFNLLPEQTGAKIQSRE